MVGVRIERSVRVITSGERGGSWRGDGGPGAIFEGSNMSGWRGGAWWAPASGEDSVGSNWYSQGCTCVCVCVCAQLPICTGRKRSSALVCMFICGYMFVCLCMYAHTGTSTSITTRTQRNICICLPFCRCLTFLSCQYTSCVLFCVLMFLSMNVWLMYVSVYVYDSTHCVSYKKNVYSSSVYLTTVKRDKDCDSCLYLAGWRRCQGKDTSYPATNIGTIMFVRK